MSTQHTPGPWSWNYITAGSTNEIKADGKRIALTLQYDPTGHRVADFHTAEANARLIATAPEMHDALKRLISFCDKIEQFKWSEELKAAKTAIAKAEGEI